MMEHRQLDACVWGLWSGLPLTGFGLVALTGLWCEFHRIDLTEGDICHLRVLATQFFGRGHSVCEKQVHYPFQKWFFHIRYYVFIHADERLIGLNLCVIPRD